MRFVLERGALHVQDAGVHQEGPGLPLLPNAQTGLGFDLRPCVVLIIVLGTVPPVEELGEQDSRVH
jgi:hypothetical protein